MQTQNNQIISKEFVDDMAKQIYNTSKILYVFNEEEKERIIKQLINDFLKQYIKIESHAVIEKSSGN